MRRVQGEEVAVAVISVKYLGVAAISVEWWYLGEILPLSRTGRDADHHDGGLGQVHQQVLVVLHVFQVVSELFGCVQVPGEGGGVGEEEAN